MTRHCARNWAALLLLLAALSLLLLACANTPADDPSASEDRLDELAADNARLESTIAAMQAAQRSADAATVTTSAPTATPTPTPTPTTAATPTPTLRPTVTPPPDTGNICYRTPEVQQAILDTLDIVACRVVTAAELFRIQELPRIEARAFKPGDFADLPNLYQLEISSETLPEPAIFDGLSGLTVLDFRIDSEGQSVALPPAMFASLPQLEGLALSCYCRMSADTLDGLPTLQGLSVRYATVYTPHALDSLGSLQYLEWEIARLSSAPESLTPYPYQGLFPRDWLAQLPELVLASVGDDNWPPIVELGSLKAAAAFLGDYGIYYRDSVAVFVDGERVDYLERSAVERDGRYVTGALLLVGDRTFEVWRLLEE